MAALAGLDAGHQHVRAFLTGRREGVAGFAGHRTVGLVAEDGIGHPAVGQGRRFHNRKRWLICRSGLSGKIELMAVLAGAQPEQLFGLADALRHPLIGILGRWELDDLRDLARGQPGIVDGIGIFTDVILKFLQQESVHDFRLLVRDGFGEVLIELQLVARRAIFFVAGGRHQFVSGVGVHHLARTRCRSGSELQVGIGILPGATGFGRWAMAITALQLHAAGWSHNGIAHVGGVVEGDGGWILKSIAQRDKLGMVAIESANICHKTRMAILGSKVRVALHALPVLHTNQPHQALVFHVTRRAGRSKELVGMVRRRLVTGEASFVADGLPETRSLDTIDDARMAQTATVGKKRMCVGERTFAVHGLLLPGVAKTEPDQSDRHNGDAENQTPKLEAAEILKVIQVVACAQRFGSSDSSHVFPLAVAQGHDGVDCAQNDQ